MSPRVVMGFGKVDATAVLTEVKQEETAEAQLI
jgi:hypothetical protein